MNKNFKKMKYNKPKVIPIINNSFSMSDDLILCTLSKYTEININDDKTINSNVVSTEYFLTKNIWEIKFFKNIPQFKEKLSNLNDNQKIEFGIINDNVNNELKFIVYNKIFSESWNLRSTIKVHRANIKRFSSFINEKYSHINSLSELDINKSSIQWIDWLVTKGIKVNTTNKYIANSVEKQSEILNGTGKFLESLLNYFEELIDTRDEWEKDKWNVKKLAIYGIDHNYSNGANCIDFKRINNIKLRESCKLYFKNKLISKSNFTWGTAYQYMTYIAIFLNYICELEPTWNNLNGLQRSHMEHYIEWLHIYASGKSNPNKYVSQVLFIIEAFLLDIQLKELDTAPFKNVRILIQLEDKPKVSKKSKSTSIQYVPNDVLDQLFNHINDLPENIIPIVYVMFKTGLRISDALELTHDCLINLEGEYWIESDIRKVNIKDHRIPIDKDLADLLAIVISKSKDKSNMYNNPKNYIFVNYSGRNRGYTYGSKWVSIELNKLAIKYNITDSNGNVFHFKNHAFRHTYAIKLLNNGVDIVTVQDLLAHASPEMTMRYAKLLDSTKRTEFDKVVKKGVFKFDESDELKEENNLDIPSNIIEMLFTNHKLNAINTPYGSCMQRKNGKCDYSKHPPCLTCNGGSPCKDLCIGASENDIKKYEILIESTQNIINTAKSYKQDEIVESNIELLNLVKKIHSTIVSGNIIYGRLDKVIKGNKGK